MKKGLTPKEILAFFLLFSILVVSFTGLGAGNPLYESGDLTVALVNYPHNKTYTTNVIPISITTGDHQFPAQGYYRIDGGPEIKISDGRTSTYKTTLQLADGLHTINVRTFTLGSACYSVAFTVNTTLPFITLVSPESRVYETSTVPLHFSLLYEEEAFQVTYNLDDKGNVTVRVLHPMPPYFPEELTWYPLANLTDGQHHVVVYANDDLGNGFSAETFFEVSATPIISFLSPKNYESTSFPLNFTIDRPVAQMAYSVDAQQMVPISGNLTLNDLPYGSHTVTVYTIDEFGHSSTSDTFFFEISAPQDQTLPLVVFIVITVIIIGGILLVFYSKYRNNFRKSLPNKDYSP